MNWASRLNDTTLKPDLKSGSTEPLGAEPRVPVRKPKLYRSDRSQILAAFVDLSQGLGAISLWGALAREEFMQRYSRTMFGALWAIGSFGL